MYKKYMLKKKCIKCNGLGLIKGDKKCDNCKNNGTKVCWLCENDDGYGKYIECFYCFGTGETKQS